MYKRQGGDPPTGIGNLWRHGGFFPTGISGMLCGFVVVMFSFGGVEPMGITAGLSPSHIRRCRRSPMFRSRCSSSH
ncbi:hypothetical protein [Escherichia coli]|uniref:hypothetical protein n=1 Tax=Escherichia coli TaxID=562 RepID=UPI003D9C1459